MRVTGSASIAAAAGIVAAWNLFAAWNLSRPIPADPARPAGDPVTFTVGDCGDIGPQVPCVTNDDGAWLIVWQYRPDYRSQSLTPCPVEDGGPVTPCVWRDRDRLSGEWVVLSRTDTLN